MTIGIVIPLKAKNISRDWRITCDALKCTIDSILNQSDSDYKVVIVGHECPEFLANKLSEKIQFKVAEFPYPNRNADDFSNQMLIDDKVLKIISGLYYLGNKDIEYYYQLDSDDLISSDFIQLIKTIKNSEGIIISGGYLLYQSANRVIETDNLDQWCGSVVVAKAGSFKIPEKIDIKYKHLIPWTKYRHMNIHQYFIRDNGFTVTWLNEKLVTYVLASGDNFSDRWRDSWVKKLKWKLKPYLKGKKKDTAFEKLFGIDR